ncbi:hypothetical protein [Nonomuraea dietziae]|uniref:hypothetical protein n=1 Tax=Nonomuraea dietziae TaxID=65515 RepID=UPI0031D8B6A4
MTASHAEGMVCPAGRSNWTFQLTGGGGAVGDGDPSLEARAPVRGPVGEGRGEACGLCGQGDQGEGEGDQGDH